MFCFDRKVCYNILRIGVFLRKKALKTLIRQERKQVVDSGIQRKRKKRSICRKEKTAYVMVCAVGNLSYCNRGYGYDKLRAYLYAKEPCRLHSVYSDKHSAVLRFLVGHRIFLFHKIQAYFAVLPYAYGHEGRT